MISVYHTLSYNDPYSTQFHWVENLLCFYTHIDKFNYTYDIGLVLLNIL